MTRWLTGVPPLSAAGGETAVALCAAWDYLGQRAQGELVFQPEYPGRIGFLVWRSGAYLCTLRLREDGWFVHPYADGDPSLHTTLAAAYDAVVRLP